MNEIKTILEDKRTIRMLVWFNDESIEIGSALHVKDDRTITKIVAYGEPSHHCDVPWFAVLSNEHIVMRVPANSVDVIYEEAGLA